MSELSYLKYFGGKVVWSITIFHVENVLILRFSVVEQFDNVIVVHLRVDCSFLSSRFLSLRIGQPILKDNFLDSVLVIVKLSEWEVLMKSHLKWGNILIHLSERESCVSSYLGILSIKRHSKISLRDYLKWWETYLVVVNILCKIDLCGAYHLWVYYFAILVSVDDSEFTRLELNRADRQGLLDSIFIRVKLNRDTISK